MVLLFGRSLCQSLLLLTLFSSYSSSLLALATIHQQRSVAIVTGGTRGIGSGIAAALAEAGYDLLLTYNTHQEAAEAYAAELAETYPDTRIECVGGDLALTETRDAIFQCLQECFPRDTHALKAFVHNAGQYVGITSDNSEQLDSTALAFGDGSLLNHHDDEDDGTISTNMETMRYYQRLYGEAWIDCCERALHRMSAQAVNDGNRGGALVGISSPSVTAHLYGPDRTYSMPGSGKCIMEYSNRVYARQAAQYGITCNIVIPGTVNTDAWKRLAKSRGLSKDDDAKELMQGVVERGQPIKELLEPRDIGNVVAFLCSRAGRFITGTVLPSDGGYHLVR